MSTDPYAAYADGLQRLLAYLGDTHPRYRDVLVYQQRLQENIASMQVFGDTETRRAERAEIIAQVNALAHAVGGPLLPAPTIALSSDPAPQHVINTSVEDDPEGHTNQQQGTSVRGGTVQSDLHGKQMKDYKQPAEPSAADTSPPNTTLPDAPHAPQSPDSSSTATIILALAIIGTLVSTVWLVRQPDFEPLLGLIASLATLIEVLVIKRRAYNLALATLAGALVLGGAAYFGFSGIGQQPVQTNTVVRVIDKDGDAISRANVILLIADEVPRTQITDVHGIARFAEVTVSSEAQLLAQADGYQPYDQVVDLAQTQNFPVVLRASNANERSLIVRVVAAAEFRPVAMAEVMLIVDGAIYREVTDQNGLATFALEFPEDTLDANLAVMVAGQQTSDQRVTLRPNQLQDVRLDIATNAIDIAPVSTNER